MIHLAGLFYGFEPTRSPDGATRRSYTQLEYELGKELRRQVFRFIARTDYLPDNEYSQTDEQAELQERHCQRLMHGTEAWSATSRTTGNELYYEFSNHQLFAGPARQDRNQSHGCKATKPANGRLSLQRPRRIHRTAPQCSVNKPTHIAAVTAKQAIHGLGGVGKTRVDSRIRQAFFARIHGVIVHTADTESEFKSNLAKLCGAMVLNLPEQTATELDVQVAAAIRWLHEHAGWFLIVDNVDTPEAAQAVEQELQRLNSGHVVITSRLADWGSGLKG